jgi:hydrogenase/urease accessory protein HupE
MRRLAALAVLLAAFGARAHSAGVSYSELTVASRAVSGELSFSLADLRTQAPFERANLSLPLLRRLVIEPFAVSAGGAKCALDERVSATMDGPDGVVVRASWTCPREVEQLSVRVAFLESFPAGAAHLSKISFGPGEIAQRVAQAEEPSFEVQRGSRAASVARVLLVGLRRSVTGYDHLVFLLALLLLATSVREAAQIFAAFALANSLTLALAALSLAAPPPRAVGPLVAASVLFAGLDGLWSLRRRRAAAPGHRWAVAFVFGLAHGFGLAGALRGLALPPSQIAAGLLAFNFGVELGLACLAALAMVAFRALRRRPLFAQLASGAAAGLGALWLAQRLL